MKKIAEGIEEKSKFVRILQFIWLLPATLLVGLFYILPLLMFKEIKYRGMPRFLIFEFENMENPGSWFDEQWKKWSGWSGPCFYIWKPHNGPGGHVMDHITMIHELRHCEQQFWLGLFFYPAYIGHSIWIYISNLWKKEKRHMYYDNWFEMDARKKAGQPIYISRDRWMDGKNDYNPWF
jgi:hypothetical protein